MDTCVLRENQGGMNVMKPFSLRGTKIPVPMAYGYLFVPLHEIVYCKAIQGYTEFRLEGSRTIVSSYTLKYFEQFLAAHNFMRVHKSYIVNLGRAIKYLRKGILVMDDGSEIGVSKTFRANIAEHIQRHFKEDDFVFIGQDK
jgi:two-component system, LytTR family, response regulator